MKRLIDHVIDQINLNERTIIGISGHGGAGKTRLAEQLQQRFGGEQLYHGLDAKEERYTDYTVTR